MVLEAATCGVIVEHYLSSCFERSRLRFCRRISISMGFDISDCSYIVFIFAVVVLIIQYFDGGGGGLRQARAHFG